MLEQQLLVLDKLLEDFYRLEILWTEGSFLSPEYLHLHEADIPGETSYQMREQLAGFLYSIPAARQELREVVFCFSREETPDGILSARQCKGEQFYSYRVQNPYKLQTFDEIKEALDLDLPGPCGEPRPRLISVDEPGDPSLRSLLSSTHIMQPYLLFSRGGADLSAEFRIRETNERDLLALIKSFRDRTGLQGCGYQFSWYGYSFRDGFEATWRNSKAHQLYLEIAFLHHIHKWNFDLRNTHKFERARQSRITDIFQLLREAKDGLDRKLEEVQGLIPAVSKKAPTPPSVVAIVNKDEALRPSGGMGLFDVALGHDIASFPSAKPTDGVSRSFDIFQARVRRYSSSGAINDLARFIKASGADEYFRTAPQLTERQRLVWERGIYSATKTMVSRARSKARQLGVDQIVLAVLFGLEQSESTSVQFSLTHRIEPLKSPEELWKSLGLEQPSGAWPAYEAAAPGGASIEWEWSGNDYLSAVTRSGLLRTEEWPSHALSFQRGISVDSFLSGLARCIGALARPTEDPKRVCLKGVKVASRGSREQEAGAAVARIQVDLLLNGVLPANIVGQGDLATALEALRKPFAADIPFGGGELGERKGMYRSESGLSLYL